MVDEATQRALDAEANRRSYEAVMGFSAEFGVPFSLALTMFFTQLVLANGIGTAIVTAVLVHLAVFFIVKMFFSH